MADPPSPLAQTGSRRKNQISNRSMFISRKLFTSSTAPSGLYPSLIRNSGCQTRVVGAHRPVTMAWWSNRPLTCQVYPVGVLGRFKFTVCTSPCSHGRVNTALFASALSLNASDSGESLQVERVSLRRRPGAPSGRQLLTSNNDCHYLLPGGSYVCLGRLVE